MKNMGFLRVAAAMPVVHVADPEANAKEIIALADTLAAEEPSVIVFPELCITGYSCADLFSQQGIIDGAEKAIADIVDYTSSNPALIAVGAPVRHRGRLFNCAVLFRRGRILGIVPKTYLAGSAEFYEPRWFESARVLPYDGVDISYAGQQVPFGVHQLFRMGKALIGVELCQDLWAPVPCCSWAATAGAQLILNLSASNDILGKHDYRTKLVSSTSSRLYAAYVYCSSGYGESTQDVVWAGSSLIAEYGGIVAENERFQYKASSIMADIDIEKLETLRARAHSFIAEESDPDAFAIRDAGEPAATDFEAKLLRCVEARPFVPQGDEEELSRRCREILSCQVAGLRTRLEHINCKKAVIGVSGGLDSTLAMLVTALAFDSLGLSRKGIIGITMPGLGTTRRTHSNSLELMDLLGTTAREIDICAAVRQHFSDIGQDEDVHDVTYENSQARERTQILMDVANKENAIVVGTGDLSELALGWCTFNGDHMSMYGVNAGVPKTLVRTLVRWAADNRFGAEVHDVLMDIADTPISPELTPADSKGEIAQKTEDIVGPYELHDFFLYNLFRCGYGRDKLLFLARKAFAGEYSDAVLEKWLDIFLKRFCRQQFKRSCLPDGPKVGSVSLSPRGDWRMPSDLTITTL